MFQAWCCATVRAIAVEIQSFANSELAGGADKLADGEVLVLEFCGEGVPLQCRCRVCMFEKLLEPFVSAVCWLGWSQRTHLAARPSVV
jgi:hypothetical protein